MSGVAPAKRATGSGSVKQHHHAGVHPGHTSSQILKVQAIAATALKITAETAMTFGRTAGVLLGAVLMPVNLFVAAWNAHDLNKHWGHKSRLEKVKQGSMIVGSSFLFAAGAALWKTYFATHSIKQMMMAPSMHTAKILGGVGLFILAGVHILKVAVALKKLALDKACEKHPIDKKGLVLEIVYNLMSAVGLVLLGLIMIGALSASAASPFGWIALGLILVGVALEITYAKKRDQACNCGISR